MLLFLLIRNCCYWAGKLAKTYIKASANRLRKSIGVACLVRLAAPAQDPMLGGISPQVSSGPFPGVAVAVSSWAEAGDIRS